MQYFEVWSPLILPPIWNIPGSASTACSDQPSSLRVRGGGIYSSPSEFQKQAFCILRRSRPCSCHYFTTVFGIVLFCHSFNLSSCHCSHLMRGGGAVRGVGILQNYTELHINTIQNNIRKPQTTLKLPKNF